MNHTWKNNKCTMCGCKRSIHYGWIGYTRSGMHLSVRPDCIDWELENSKTID